jgi:DNA-binding beta-propeller fold protein YncE
MKGRWFILLTTLATLAAAGCVQPRRDPLQPTGQPIYWPPSPDKPRVRYLGALRGSGDLTPTRTLADMFDELMHGPAAATSMLTPHAVAVHENGTRIAVADTNTASVHVFDLAAQQYREYRRVGDGERVLGCPAGVAWIGDGLWVVDSKLPALIRFGDGEVGQIVAETDFVRPSGLAYCESTDLCYVTDAGANAVFVFDRGGTQVARFGRAGGGPGELNRPGHIDCHTDGTLVVADALNFRVQLLESDGTPIAAFGAKGDAAGDFALPKGVAFDADGNVWVVDAQFENVQAFTRTGRLLLALGEEGNREGQFWLPAGVCIDHQNRMWVADSYNRRVQVFELLP